MLARPSFANELKAYSARLAAATERAVKEGRPIEAQRKAAENAAEKHYGKSLIAVADISHLGKEQPKSAKRLTAHQQHLHDWIEDERAQEIWSAITKRAAAADAQEFIRSVLKARSEARGLIARLAHRKAERAATLDRCANIAAKLFASNCSPSEIADRLESMADSLRDLDEFWAFLIPDDVEVSRKDQSGTRERKLFAQQISRIVHKLCEQWRDSEVAALTEIAFPGCAVDEEQIRKWRTRRDVPIAH
jgi:hypothetical protein